MDFGYTELDRIPVKQVRAEDYDIKSFWKQGELTMDEQASLARYTVLDPAELKQITLDDPRYRSIPLPQSGHMIVRGKCKLGDIPVSITAFKHWNEYIQNHNGAVKTGMRDWREYAHFQQMPIGKTMGAIFSVYRDGAWIKVKNHGLLIWFNANHTLAQHFWYSDQETVEMTDQLYEVLLRQY